MNQDPNQYPAGWDQARVKALIDHYENQTEDEAVAEDEAAFTDPGQTFIQVPVELVPAVQELIARHKKAG